MALAFGGGTWTRLWLASSPRFAVTELSISGNQRLSHAAISRAMGLSGGENIFSLDLAMLESSLVAHPWIREAEVERRLPDRLRIELIEQKAAAVAELGGLYLIDEDGVPFKRAAVDRGEGLGMIVITGIGREEYAASPERAHERFRDAMELVVSYGSIPSRPELGEIHLGARRGITLYTRERAMAIRIGTGTRAQRLARLAAFDAAWTALSEHERDSAVVIHANRDSTPQRVSVAFSQSR